MASRDHPRGCGAHFLCGTERDTKQGSSPRVRGSPTHMVKVGMGMGIIPAGAGLTMSLYSCCNATRDHPRGCGAHLYLALFMSAATGSSPRVRGSLQLVSTDILHTGIIPAGAGLTKHSSFSVVSARDHPRGCGAHFGFSDRRSRRPGSSPRVRGSLQH